MAQSRKKPITLRGRGKESAQDEKVSRRDKGPRGQYSASKKKRAVKKKTVKRRRTIESVEGGIRLNKLLAEIGLASRRKADEIILEGHITVDGEPVYELGLKVDLEKQVVEHRGMRLESADKERKQYYLLNKPTGVVCTNERREAKPKAIDLINDRAKGRIYTVGRLDEESKGLIILTNDGEFANRVMHPRYGVLKTYMVKLRGRITDEGVQKIREGVYLAEGKMGQSRVLIKRRTREQSLLEITLREGKNREIRRVFHSVGFKVMELRRTSIGNVNDRKLKVGYWRFLTPEEVVGLVQISEGDEGQSETSEGPAKKKATRKAAGRKKTARRGQTS
jgi:23S rRNA pseudouridine2605 synthase